MTEKPEISHENKLREARRIIYKRAKHREMYQKRVHIQKEWNKLEDLVSDIN